MMTLYLCICGLGTDDLRRLDDHLADHPGHHERDSGRTAQDADTEADWPVPEPLHPIGQLTTSELTGYRRAVESAMRAAPAANPVQDRLRQRLGEVITEQDQRAQSAQDSCADEADRARRRDSLHA